MDQTIFPNIKTVADVTQISNIREQLDRYI